MRLFEFNQSVLDCFILQALCGEHENFGPFKKPY